MLKEDGGEMLKKKDDLYPRLDEAGQHEISSHYSEQQKFKTQKLFPEFPISYFWTTIDN